MSNKRFITIFLTILLGGLIFIGAANFLVDPIFHYHAPLNKISYTMDDERYQNNGIMKHFDYDCIITGTSMVENTKASLVDSLFDVKSVKTCFMGGSYREISENIRVGLKNNSKVELGSVLGCLSASEIKSNTSVALITSLTLGLFLSPTLIFSLISL